jgi:hypothetical protein
VGAALPPRWQGRCDFELCLVPEMSFIDHWMYAWRGEPVDNLAIVGTASKGLDSLSDLSILSRLRLISGAARIRVAL